MTVGNDNVLDGEEDDLQNALDFYWFGFIPDESFIRVQTIVLNEITYVVFTADTPEQLKSLQLNAPEYFLGFNNVNSRELSQDEIINAIGSVEQLNDLQYMLQQPDDMNLEGDLEGDLEVDNLDDVEEDKVSECTTQ